MKFGLIVPGKKKTNVSVAPKTSIFDEDEDFENDEEKELAALRKAKLTTPVSKSISTSDQFVEKLQKEALKEDPNIFDYDAAFETDDLNRKTIHRNLRYAGTLEKNDEQHTKSSETEPKYMKNILIKAEERKIESELIKLRNMKRKYGESEAVDEEIFVTSAYKERLKELEEKEKELKALQFGEEDGDVTKKKDMTGFYYNLMKRNVSFGGEKLKLFAVVPKKHKLEREEEPATQKIEVKEKISESPEISSEVSEPVEQVVFGPRRPPVKK